MSQFTKAELDKLKRDPAKLRELIAEQERIIALAAEQVPCMAFVPNPPQYRLTKRLAETVVFNPDGSVSQPVRQVGAFWGNGTGKSWWTVNVIANIVWGPQNRWFQYPLFAKWPFKKHIRLVCKATEMMEYTGELWKAIQRWWPKHKYRAQKQGFNYLAAFEFLDDAGASNGFLMDVRTFDQDRLLHESAGLGCAIFDEPPPQEIYQCYPARFREGGFRLMCATLVFESAWIEENFIDNPEAAYEYARAEENCKEHSVLVTPQGECRGTLSHESIANRIKDYPEEEREARDTGKPVHHQGSYFEINDDLHFVARSLVPAKDDLTTYLVVDPHPSRPWSIIVGGMDALHDWWQVDEWPRLSDFQGKAYHKVISDKRGVGDYAEIIRRLREKWGVAENIIDGKFANSPFRTLNMTTTLRDQLLLAGLWFADGNPNVVGDGGGIRLLQQLLGWDRTRPVDFNNRPRFRVAEDLHNSRLALRNFCRKKKPDGIGYLDTPEEKFLDFPRCMMYLVMHRADYTPATATGPEAAARRRFEKRLSLRGGLDDQLEPDYADQDSGA